MYTYEDLEKAPIGTKITFEDDDNEILIKCFEDENEEKNVWKGDNSLRSTEDLKDFKDNYGISGRIIKIEEPVDYKTVYEYKEFLDDKEKAYLRAVIKPFRNRIRCIEKCDYLINGERVKESEYIRIELTPTIKAEEIYCEEICLPAFKENTMYKNMEIYNEYSLEELGL